MGTARWKRGLGEGVELLHTPRLVVLPHLKCSATQKLSEPILLTLLWRLHCLGMADKSLTIGD